MEKEDLAETYASGIDLNTTKQPIPHLIEQAYLDGYNKGQNEIYKPYCQCSQSLNKFDGTGTCVYCNKKLGLKKH